VTPDPHDICRALAAGVPSCGLRPQQRWVYPVTAARRTGIGLDKVCALIRFLPKTLSPIQVIKHGYQVLITIFTENMIQLFKLNCRQFE